jgi:3-hydroxyacyl-CoA dehydrogenase
MGGGLMRIEKAAVIGAGVMGSGIAAKIANAGVPVLLLDIPSGNGGDRSALAQGAIQRMLKADPAPFMHKGAAKLVEAGNTEDDLGRLAEADWIIEVVVEDLEVKHALYARIEEVRKNGSIVSSNTSTLPLALLVEGQSERFARDFLITHFFNPPRYMRLLELVAGEQTRPEALGAIRDFADRRLGKGVVLCNDTPGFVANRIGNFWLQCAVNAARDHALTVEEADAVMSRPVGIPKTGVFGLLDLVGLDLIPRVDASLAAALPEGDAYHGIRRGWPLLDRLIADGYTGRKGKGGFYRLDRSGGKRVKEAIDLETGDYAPAARPALESLTASKSGGLKALVEHDDRGGRFAWAVLSQTLSYAATHVPETTDAICDVDRALKFGYAWKYGPFELIDRLGAAYFAERLEKAPGGRAAARGREARERALSQERLGQLVGYRRRGRLSRGPHQAEHHRCGRDRHHRKGAQDGRDRLQGTGRLQRGLELLGRRQPGARAVRRQHRALAHDRRLGRAGPEGLS